MNLTTARTALRAAGYQITAVSADTWRIQFGQGPHALDKAEAAPGEHISEVEQAMIRGAVEAGKGKTESLQALKGYSGRRHREYSAAWDAARAEPGQAG